MRLLKVKSYKEASHHAANLIAAQILVKPNSVMGLATGSTPLGTYEELIGWYKRGDLSFEDVTSVNLDEYLGLEKSDPQSYNYFMKENLHSHINIKPENVHLPDGAAKDIAGECKRYDNLIDKIGGIDIQLLGIGANGHIAFNEPSEFITDTTYCIEITQSTIDANKRFFEKEEDVPRKAFTMGIGTIMRARKTLMIITGENKAEVLKEMLQGNISPMLPASLMRLHPDFTLIADEDALKLL